MEIEETSLETKLSEDSSSNPSPPPLKQLQHHLETCIEILRCISFILYEFQEDSQTVLKAKL
jgi:hypothetical protein